MLVRAETPAPAFSFVKPFILLLSAALLAVTSMAAYLALAGPATSSNERSRIRMTGKDALPSAVSLETAGTFVQTHGATGGTYRGNTFNEQRDASSFVAADRPTNTIFSAEPVDRTVSQASSSSPRLSSGGQVIDATGISSRQNVAPISLPPARTNIRPATIKVESVAIPLALAEVDPLTANLGGKEWAAVDEAAAQFVKSVGGANQNPNDPAYLARWRTAQPISDQLLKAKIGWQAFNQLQLAAWRATLQEQQ